MSGIDRGHKGDTTAGSLRGPGALGTFRPLATLPPGARLPASVRLHPCASASDWRLFERLPEILHGSDPAYVPPFPGDVMKLRKGSHPFHRDGTLTPYVAFDGSRPVGRIAAILNRTHNRLHADRTGFFGFFDFTDQDVAAALLDRVRANLRGAGMTLARGPFSPTQNDECGLHVAGLGEPPYFGMPYNPPRYVEAYAALGLSPARDLLAYYIDPALEESFRGRMGRLADRIRERFPVTVRPVDLGRVREEAELVSRLFNESLGAEWNFMPLSTETTLHFAQDLLREIEPEAILIAEVNGKPAGLSIGLPNLNEFLADAKRFPRWLRWPRLVWLIKTRRCRRARWAVFAMLPEYRRRGGTALLIYEAVLRMKGRYEAGELSWTQDVNDEINGIAQQLGLAPYKRYRIYEMPL